MPGPRRESHTPREGSPRRKGFLLRLSPAVLDELRRWAAQDLRSLNGQIEFLLREAIARRKKSQEGGGS